MLALPAMWSPWVIGPAGAMLGAAVLALAFASVLACVAFRLPRAIDPDLPNEPTARHRRLRAGFLTVAPALAALCAWRYGFTAASAAAILYIVVLLALAWIDAETGLLPDALTQPLLWLGLLVNLNGAFTPLADAVLGAMAGYLLLWSVSQAFLLATGRVGMGHGDLKLLAALGAWMGWGSLPSILLLSSGLALAAALAMRVLGRLEAGQALRYGPYLAGAGIWALLSL